MIPSYLPPLANHLWQSTLFAAVAGLLTLALKKNRAQVRYWLWLAASAKFLIPFSLLVSVGSHFGWPTVPDAPAQISRVMEQISQPFRAVPIPVVEVAATSPAFSFVPSLLIVVWLFGGAAVLLFWIVRWRRVQTVLHASSLVRDGHELESLRRLERNAGIQKPIHLMSSPAALEPGVFGILRPVLLLPSGISEHLTDSQLEAILAHELSHAHRRDNLAAAIHMLVEAVFWFHPLVWWLGARLVDERERACDEQVLRIGNDPQVYAEGILKVCEFYLQSPLTCVSGVSGADLKKRIETTMTASFSHKLNFGRKLLLASVGMAAVSGPIVIGVLNAPAIHAQSAAASPQFEVAAIKVSKSPAPGGDVQLTPGRFRGKDLALQWLILVAYKIKSSQLSGALPSWTISERYDIDAKTEDASSDDRTLLMLQKLLEDRFRLRLHHETREEPVYELTVGKSSVKMQPGTCVPSVADLPNECYGIQNEGLIGILDWRGVHMSEPAGVAYRSLVWQLSSILQRPVIDKTGLTGTFDVHLRWARDPEPGNRLDDSGAPAPSADATPAPSIMTALQEQLGLKLESARGPVEYLIVDHVEKPSEN